MLYDDASAESSVQIHAWISGRESPSVQSCRRGAGLRTFRKPEFFVESVSLGLSAQKVDQRRHLVLAAALFENSVAVATTFLGIHWVFLEDGIKHISRVYLRTEVAIITCSNHVSI